VRVRVPAEPTNRYCVGAQLKVWVPCRELDGMLSLKDPTISMKLNVDFGPNLGMPVRTRQNCLSTGPKHTIQYIYVPKKVVLGFSPGVWRVMIIYLLMGK